MRVPETSLERQIDFVCRAINSVLFDYWDQKQPRGWRNDLQGGCATGAFLVFDVLTKFGHNAFVARGNYDDNTHAFCIVQQDVNHFYIADPTFAQFDYSRPYHWRHMEGRIGSLRSEESLPYWIEQCSRNHKYINYNIFRGWREQHPGPHVSIIRPRIIGEVGPKLVKIQGS